MLKLLKFHIRSIKNKIEFGSIIRIEYYSLRLTIWSYNCWIFSTSEQLISRILYNFFNTPDNNWKQNLITISINFHNIYCLVINKNSNKYLCDWGTEKVIYNCRTIWFPKYFLSSSFVVSGWINSKMFLLYKSTSAAKEIKITHLWI